MSSIISALPPDVNPQGFPKRYVWIDSAPLVSSPRATGRLKRVEVLHEHGNQLYVDPPNGQAMYINRVWVRPAPKE